MHGEIKKSHKLSEVVIFPKFSHKLSFKIVHTARTVEYETDSFVEKNKDELSSFLKRSIDTANPVIQGIFK